MLYRARCSTGRAEAKSQPALPPAEEKQKQNPKSKIQNPRARPGAEQARICSRPSDSGFWILDFGFCLLPFARLGSGDETGDEAEDPNDSLRIRAPFHSVTPEAESQEGGQALRILQQEFSGPSGNLGKILQNPTPKIPESQGGRITAALEFCLEGLAEQKLVDEF